MKKILLFSFCLFFGSMSAQVVKIDIDSLSNDLSWVVSKKFGDITKDSVRRILVKVNGKVNGDSLRGNVNITLEWAVDTGGSVKVFNARIKAEQEAIVREAEKQVTYLYEKYPTVSGNLKPKALVKSVPASYSLVATPTFMLDVSPKEATDNFQEVTGVHDGDTYTVKGLSENVRIIGVDCPEVISNHISQNQELGVAIGDSVRALLKGNKVVLGLYGKDMYNRNLATVLVDGQDLASIILRKGWGWYLSSKLPASIRKGYQKDRDFAKSHKLGIWANPSPMNPKDFRKKFHK